MALLSGRVPRRASAAGLGQIRPVGLHSAGVVPAAVALGGALGSVLLGRAETVAIGARHLARVGNRLAGRGGVDRRLAGWAGRGHRRSAEARAHLDPSDLAGRAAGGGRSLRRRRCSSVDANRSATRAAVWVADDDREAVDAFVKIEAHPEAATVQAGLFPPSGDRRAPGDAAPDGELGTRRLRGQFVDREHRQALGRGRRRGRLDCRGGARSRCRRDGRRRLLASAPRHGSHDGDEDEGSAMHRTCLPASHARRKARTAAVGRAARTRSASGP